MDARSRRSETVRAALEAHLGGKVRDSIWETLVEAGHVGNVLESDDLEAAISGLAEDADLLEADRRGRRPGERVPVEAVQLDPGQLALATICAIDASRLPEVEEFRREVLRGRFIKIDRIGQWVARRAEPPTPWVRVPLGSGQVPETLEEARAAGRQAEWATLEWRSHEGRKLQHHVKAGSVLERLVRLAEGLTRRYGWEEAAATSFVLTGLVPQLSFFWVNEGWKLEPFPNLSRLTMTIDPRISPNDARAIYQKHRESLLGEGRRHKPITEKHARLAIFAAEGNTGRTWDDLRREWNRTAPREWRYSDAVPFLRDCRQAYQRVTGRKLEWIGGGE